MNAFNRIFVIIALIVLLVAGAITLAVPALTLNFIRTTADSMHTTFFASFSDVARVIVRILLALVWVLLMALLIWVEFRRPGSRTIEVARYTGGSAIRISTAAVADKVEEAVNAAGGIIDAKVKATGRNRAVELRLDVTATKDTNLVQKAEEIASITRQVVQDHLGLKLAGKPEVAIKAKQGKPIKMTPVARNLPPLVEDAPPASATPRNGPPVSVTEDPSPIAPTPKPTTPAIPAGGSGDPSTQPQ